MDSDINIYRGVLFRAHETFFCRPNNPLNAYFPWFDLSFHCNEETRVFLKLLLVRTTAAKQALSFFTEREDMGSLERIPV